MAMSTTFNPHGLERGEVRYYLHGGVADDQGFNGPAPDSRSTGAQVDPEVIVWLGQTAYVYKANPANPTHYYLDPKCPGALADKADIAAAKLAATHSGDRR